MIQNKYAFTLIELLVVVLIIGILAAVALPQYQKAVMKSRTTQAFITGRAFMNAQAAYYLANGTYAADFDKLDVKLIFPTEWYYSISSDGHLNMAYVNYDIAWDFYPSRKIAYCIVRKTATQASALQTTCQNLTGNLNPTSDNLLSGGRYKYQMNF